MTQAATETTPTETPAPEAETPAPVETPTPEAETPEADDKDPRVQRANREAAKYRTERNTLQAELEAIKATQDALRKALTGEAGDKGEDPAKVAERLTGEVDGLRATNTALTHQVAVLRAAPKAGADGDALLDSLTFTKSLDALDASAEDYPDQVAAAIVKAVESNKSLRASQGPGRGGAPGAGSAGDSTVTREQFDAMGYQARAELYETNPSLYRQLAG